MTEESRTRDEVVEALEQLAQFGVPSQGAARLFDVGSDEFIRYFEREVFDELIANGGSTCKIFEGSYGSGKTHLLQLLEDSALDRGMAVVRTDLSQALNLEDWHLITQHVLQNIELKTPRGIVRSLPRVLDALGKSGTADIGALRTGILPHVGFARAMALACDPRDMRHDTRQLLAKYLQGEKVSATALKADGVSGVKHPLSRRNAELVLKTVLAGLQRLGLPGTVLLFDEMEKTFTFKRHAPPKKVVAGANLLRRLIDASANRSLVSTAIVFAVLPDFVDNCSLAYAALGQRLRRPPADGRIGWRWPVLKVENITTERDPGAFVTALVARHETVLSSLGVNLNGARQEMIDGGTRTLLQHAGSDYRRYVAKKIATLALSHIS